MWDMVDRPEWLHQFIHLLMERVLAVQDEAEALGDWQLACGQNQAMTYSLEPRPTRSPTARRSRAPSCGALARRRNTPWFPRRCTKKFLYRYQMPILRSGWWPTAAEDLTRKLDMLKELPNLRRIAITPVADVAASVEWGATTSSPGARTRRT